MALRFASCLTTSALVGSHTDAGLSGMPQNSTPLRAGPDYQRTRRTLLHRAGPERDESARRRGKRSRCVSERCFPRLTRPRLRVPQKTIFRMTSNLEASELSACPGGKFLRWWASVSFKTEPEQKTPASCRGLRANGRTRTGDLLITSEPLYQLSYVGPCVVK